jgi:hypothetical protein|tara:strand:- start:387 stop:533 length:147 start_codon:yes stop_codon:yes gene_type:complete
MNVAKDIDNIDIIAIILLKGKVFLILTLGDLKYEINGIAKIITDMNKL